MKNKRNILFLAFLVFLLSNCMTYDAYILEPINESKILGIDLGFWAIQPSLFISFYSESDKPINDIEIKNLFIQAGDIKIAYNPRRLRYQKKLSQVQQFINENNNYYIYETSFLYAIDEYVGEKIKNENISDFKFILEYILILDNEIIQNNIEQEYNLRIKKSSMRMGF